MCLLYVLDGVYYCYGKRAENSAANVDGCRIRCGPVKACLRDSMNFLRKLWGFDKAIGFAITVAGVVLSFITWISKPNDVVFFYWLVVVFFSAFTLVLIFLMVSHGLHQQNEALKRTNEKLERELAEVRNNPLNEIIPRITSCLKREKNLYFIASFSPLFLPETKVCILRADKRAGGAPIPEYNGCVERTDYESKTMQILIESYCTDGRNWIRVDGENDATNWDSLSEFLVKNAGNESFTNSFKISYRN